jgi:hypothetical protein
MTDSTQPAAPAHSSARRTAREPHAVSDRADVPIAATKFPQANQAATKSSWSYGRNSVVLSAPAVSVAADYRSRRSK